MYRELFENSLRTPLEFWYNKSKREVQDLMGMHVAKMVGFSQNNPHHCYDLFGHTLHTVQEIPEDAPVSIRVAAFYHDIGKPEVVMKKEGRFVFYGHAKMSVEITKPLLRELVYAEEEINEICFYIEHHDDFIQWHLQNEMEGKNPEYAYPIKDSTIRKYCRKLPEKLEAAGVTLPEKEILENLLLLCFADASAQAEEVYMNGKLCDSKKHKLEKLEEIRKLIEIGTTI